MVTKRTANGTAKHERPDEIQLMTVNGHVPNNTHHGASHGHTDTNLHDREIEIESPGATLIPKQPNGGWEGMNYPEDIPNFKSLPTRPPINREIEIESPGATLIPKQANGGWEGMNYPEDILNFKSLTNVLPPNDRLKLVFVIMLMNGIATLMPWNMFITAKAYFEDYKLNVNGTDGEYRDFFMNYLGILSQFPNALMAFLNIACHCGMTSKSQLKRVVWSIVLIMSMFIVTVILAVIDTSAWPEEFFWVTMVTVVIINAANGVYQNCVYGIAAKLPMKYTNAVILGSNLSGTVAALVGILSIAVSPNLRIAAIYYFISAIVILVVAFDCYFLLPLMRFYRWFDDQSKLHVENHTPKKERTKDDHTTEELIVQSKTQAPPYLAIFKKIWIQMLNVWFVFFISLGIFPAIQAAIRPLDPDFPVHPNYWTPVFCFLSFNVFATLGNFTTEFIKFPSHRFLWIPVVIRGLFLVPFFMLCNYRPEIRDLTLFPVVVNNDWVYIVGAALNSFLSGYLSSLAMMYAPKLVPPHQAGAAGMMMACALCVGVFTGTLFSLALAKIFTEFGSLPAL